MQKILIVVILLFIFYRRMIQNCSLKEHISPGTLTQLVAKGPQDTYLTGDAQKWIFPPNSYGYTNFVWNNPTRLYTNYPYYYYSDLYPYVHMPITIPY